MSCYSLQELVVLHHSIEDVVQSRLREFSALWTDASDEELFAELVFCILTPQSRARSCWRAVEDICSMGFLLTGSEENVLSCLDGVRFKYKKAGFVVSAREHFVVDGRVFVRSLLEGFGSPEDMRVWLVSNVKGLGYKEASHFLRNIGLGGELAILDRHILRNLCCLGVVDDAPGLSPKKYIAVERRMQEFSAEAGIPMDELDLVFWYEEAGEVFK